MNFWRKLFGKEQPKPAPQPTIAATPLPVTTQRAAPPQSSNTGGNTLSLESYLTGILNQIDSHGYETFLADRRDAFEHQKQGFSTYDMSSLNDIIEIWELAKTSEGRSDWKGLRAGAHHVLNGLTIYNRRYTADLKQWVLKENVPRGLRMIGVANTGLGDFKRAQLFLEAAQQSMEWELDSARSNTQTYLDLDTAVCAVAAGDLDRYAGVLTKLRARASRSGQFDSDPGKWAHLLFGIGMNSQGRQDANGKPLRHSEAHAIALFQVSADFNRDIKDLNGLGITLVNLGCCHATLGNKAEAEKCWAEGKEFIKTAGDHALLSQVEKLILKHS